MEFDYKAAQKQIDALVPLVKKEVRKQVKALLWPEECVVKIRMNTDSRRVKHNSWDRTFAYTAWHIVLSVPITKRESHYRVLIVLGVREQYRYTTGVYKHVAMVVTGLGGTHRTYTTKNLEARIPQAAEIALQVLEDHVVRAAARRDREVQLKEGAEQLAKAFPKWSCDRWDETRRRKEIGDLTLEAEVTEDGYRLKLDGEVTEAHIKKIVKVLKEKK